ncbi:hypothetical protein DFH09DRAFT_1480337 [Mycena vulgaris]|nr:hypothetical protein DFH09DRAFT_1480337 [Mycena vulgaris]
MPLLHLRLSRLRFRARAPPLTPAGLQLKDMLLRRMWVALAQPSPFVNSIAWRDDVLHKVIQNSDHDGRVGGGSRGVVVHQPPAVPDRQRQDRVHHPSGGARPFSRSPNSLTQKRRAALIDALICVLFPLVYVALRASPLPSLPAVPRLIERRTDLLRPQPLREDRVPPRTLQLHPHDLLSMIWPPLLGLASAAYGALALRAFLRRRAAFAQFLFIPSSSHASGLTPSRYLRLMALALTHRRPLGPWRSLSDTHVMFSRVEQIPATLWRGSPQLVLAPEFSRWASPTCALIFFAFFGFAVEARRHYALFFASVITALWSGAARLSMQRPTSGSLAAAPATSSFASSKGLGGPSAKAKGGFSSKAPLPARKPISNPIPIPIPVGLPTYSFDGTGSFTDVGTSSPSASSHFTDLKRAGSVASSATSRFVERFDSVHSAAHGQREEEEEPETPATATSFASSSPSSTQKYTLPLHVAWHDAAYPESPASPAYPYIVGEHDGEDGGGGGAVEPCVGRTFDFDGEVQRGRGRGRGEDARLD